MAHGFNFLGERVPDQYFATPRACDVVAGRELHAKLMAEYGLTAQPHAEATAPVVAEIPAVQAVEVPEVAIVFGAVAHT